MRTSLHHVEVGDWSFEVVADINRSTGLCMLDVLGTMRCELSAEQLSHYSWEELHHALKDNDLRDRLSTQVCETKSVLIAEHARELRFTHVLNQSLHALCAALDAPRRRQAKRVRRIRHRLLSLLYKMGIRQGFRVELAQRCMDIGDKVEARSLFSELETSRGVLTAHVREKCAEVEQLAWETLIACDPRLFDPQRLFSSLSRYSTELVCLRSFVVERGYLPKIRAFCARFSNDALFRERVLKRETLIHRVRA